MFKTLATATAAITTLGAPAFAIGPIGPVQGDISPLYGKINPFYGDVAAEYGKINPFYGKINPFYGTINPFFGDVSSYYGKINPFSQTVEPSMLAFYGTNFDPFWGSGPTNPYKAPSPGGITYSKVAPFWTTTFANWQTILPIWNSATTQADAANVAYLIKAKLLDPAYAFWGPAISKAPKTGTTTATLIASQLAAAGVTFNSDGSVSTASLLRSDPSARAMLFLNLYDDLMDYAGTGHVDWWMGQVGWSPLLAQTAGKTPAGGSVPTVGMIDFAIQVTAGADGKPIPGVHLSKQIVQYGSQVFDDGHGAAVGSLIMGAVDGSDVMGVMPANSVNVMVYDPYDSTGTTNWTDVGKGIATLNSAIFKGKALPLGVLNASLGVAGWTLNPGWNDALQTAGAHGRDLVVAAGNDGSTQTQNVVWNFAATRH